ncbi:hypothetical protein L8P05_24780 [Enterobacter cloacae]|uniref:hypothetical protein n=1 Tax=Enterobacter cloacae TaxID=550 RepID=UPI0020066917|nr:hypothetical protein [Enterobacter cloacae]MCK7177125.1 hypothetical protein [Enterobacter cloacae]
MQNKTLIPLFLLALTLVLVCCFSLRAQPLRCDSEQTVEIDTPTIKSSMDAKVSFLIGTTGEGTIAYTGSVTHNTIKHQLNREVFFRYRKSEHENIYYIVTFKQNKKVNDNTPDDIFYNYYLPSPLLTEFPIEVFQSEHNALIVKGLNHAYFMCALKYGVQ